MRLTLSNVRIVNSGSGIASSAGAAITIERSVFTNNSVVGVQVGPSAQATVKSSKAEGDGILKIGRTVGVGTSVVQRVVNRDARQEVV